MYDLPVGELDFKGAEWRVQKNSSHHDGNIPALLESCCMARSLLTPACLHSLQLINVCLISDRV